MTELHSFSTTQWNERFSETNQQHAIQHLERGNILCFPNLNFSFLPEENPFFDLDYSTLKSKNISYHQHKLSRVKTMDANQSKQLEHLLERFSRSAYQLIQSLLPHYIPNLKMGRTSFRPVEIDNRPTSYRKDDKRLHVDAFPSSPTQGHRILRVFCNVNPYAEDRVWRVGESFENVARRFFSEIRRPFWGSATILNFFRITKTHRSLYDHYMLQLHDRMKQDEQYQKTVPQQEIRFPAHSTWIVQTDSVSHAAMKGRFVIEKTFTLPPHGMKDETLSPLRILENLAGKPLI